MNWLAADGLFKGIESGTRFYFVHSYQYQTKSDNEVAACVDYGSEIVAVVRRGNIVGTQFHPEKSRIGGLQLLRNFLRMTR